MGILRKSIEDLLPIAFGSKRLLDRYVEDCIRFVIFFGKRRNVMLLLYKHVEYDSLKVRMEQKNRNYTAAFYQAQKFHHTASGCNIQKLSLKKLHENRLFYICIILWLNRVTWKCKQSALAGSCARAPESSLSCRPWTLQPWNGSYRRAGLLETLFLEMKWKRRKRKRKPDID